VKYRFYTAKGTYYHPALVVCTLRLCDSCSRRTDTDRSEDRVSVSNKWGLGYGMARGSV